jgi:hypothetical protein
MCALGQVFRAPPPARTTATKVEVVLVQHGGDGGSATIAGNAGELPGREPGSVVPYAGLETGVEFGKLPLEAGLALIGHTGLHRWGYRKARKPAGGRNSTPVPQIAYTWRGCNLTRWYTSTYAQ